MPSPDETENAKNDLKSSGGPDAGPTGRPPSDPASLEPATISAEDLHRETAFSAALENGWKLRLAYRLLAHEETGLHRQLGCSSVAQYAEREYRRDHRQTLEMIRVARALRELPKLRETYLMGRLDWSCLEHLSRVATRETEDDWVAFAARKPARVIRMEVQDALEKKRKHPRKDGYSLPDAKVSLTFNLRRSQYEIVQKGMGAVEREMALRLGGQKPRPEETLTFMSLRFLETEPEGKLKERAEKEESLFTILYHLCPECREKRRPQVMMTSDGPVEVPVEAVERVEAEARKETITPEEEELPSPEAGPGAGDGPAGPPTIDRPNPPSLLRKLKLRAGGVCQNPFCGRKTAIQGDHLRERSKGGPTTLGNEWASCVWCHGLRTQGLLEVRGNPVTGMEFITPADRIDASLEPELRRMAQAPLGWMVVPPNGSDVNEAKPPLPRTGYGSDDDLECLAGGLENLGHKKRYAWEALRKARQALEALGKSLTDENLLRTALEILHPRRSGPLRAPG